MLARRRAPWGRRRSATRARSAATSEPRLRRATRCRRCSRSTQRSCSRAGRAPAAFRWPSSSPGRSRTRCRPDEVILAAEVAPARGPQEFVKVGTRNAMVISVASVALVVDTDARSVRARSVRSARWCCARPRRRSGSPRESTGTHSASPTLLTARRSRRWSRPRPDRSTTTVRLPPTGATRSRSVPAAPLGAGAVRWIRVDVSAHRQRHRSRRCRGLDRRELLYVLRERLGLPGAKNACEQGECGSCSVLCDGVLAVLCLVLAATMTTSRSQPSKRSPTSGALSDVQQAFVDAGAVQCGFCTPGLVMAVHDLLARSPEPDDLELREAISGNLCRCTGYGRILQAVRDTRRRRSREPASVTDDHRAHAAAHRVSGRARPAPTASPRCRARFAFGSDLWADGMLWGATLRSPHPSARIMRIDLAPAWQIPGVRARRHRRRRPGHPTYGLEHARPAGVRARRRALRRRADRRGRGRPPRDRPPGGRRDQRRVRAARPAHRSRGGDRRRADPSRRQSRSVTCASATATSTRPARSSSKGLRGRDAGPGLPRPRSRAWPSPTTTVRRRAVHLDAVAARRSRPGGRVPRPPARTSAPHARGRRRRVRCAARTSACRCTSACWRCAPAGR